MANTMVKRTRSKRLAAQKCFIRLENLADWHTKKKNILIISNIIMDAQLLLNLYGIN